MRRLGWIALLTAGACLGFAATATARQAVVSLEVAYRNITVKVDGKPVQTGGEPFVVVSDGRAYAPIRGLAAALGGQVGWDPTTSTVTVDTPRRVVETTVGQLTTYRIPYWDVSLQAPAGGRVQPRDPATNAGLYLVVDDPVGRIILTRLDPVGSLRSSDMAYIFAVMTQGFYPNVSFPAPRSVQVSGSPDAVEMDGTGTQNGSTVIVKTRVVFDGRSYWGLAVAFDPDQPGQSSPAADQVLSSFRFPNLEGGVAY